jgi:cation transport ATPase
LLLLFTYLAEKGSEHPLAKAIVKKIDSLIPSMIEEQGHKYKVLEFKNRDGEGVVASIIEQGTNTAYEVLCGNDKLVKAYDIGLFDEEMKKNIEMLEEEGMTVISVIVNNVP